MAKPRSPTVDFAIYLALKAMACALLMMPLAWSLGFVRVS